MLLPHDHQSAPLTVSILAPVLQTTCGSPNSPPAAPHTSADSDLLDESIHLTSAFQLARSRHVIGTR
jgi:hypothetical protein